MADDVADEQPHGHVNVVAAGPPALRLIASAGKRSREMSEEPGTSVRSSYRHDEPAQARRDAHGNLVNCTGLPAGGEHSREPIGNIHASAFPQSAQEGAEDRYLRQSRDHQPSLADGMSTASPAALIASFAMAGAPVSMQDSSVTVT